MIPTWLSCIFQQGGSPEAVSVKSGKTQKSEDKKTKKGPSPDKEKKEEFVVGKIYFPLQVYCC